VCANFKTTVEPGPSVVKREKRKRLASAEKLRVKCFTKVSEDNPCITLD
jgi:hypothetical protein